MMEHGRLGEIMSGSITCLVEEQQETIEENHLFLEGFTIPNCKKWGHKIIYTKTSSNSATCVFDKLDIGQLK